MLIDPATLTPGAMYRFMISAIVPRPIAFVSTIGASGITNVAPFSYFVPLASRPPLVGISINTRAGEPKDTLRNLRETGDFVVNIVDASLLERMVHASGEWAPDVSEFALTGLTAAKSERVRAPRVAESRIHLECRLHQEVPLGDTTFVIGEIVLAHADDGVMIDGLVDPVRLRPVGRLGADGYTVVSEVLRQARPRREETAR